MSDWKQAILDAEHRALVEATEWIYSEDVSAAVALNYLHGILAMTERLLRMEEKG